MLNIIKKISDLIKERKYSTAMNCIDNHLVIDTNNINLLHLKAYIYQKNNNILKAEEVFLNILDIYPYDEIAVDSLFRLYSKTNRSNDAFNIISRLSHQETFETTLAIAKTYYNLYLYEDALKYANKLEKLYPNNIEVYLLLSNIYLSLDFFDISEVYFNKAKELK